MPLLAAATLLHVMVFLIPVARHAVLAPKQAPSVRVTLQKPVTIEQAVPAATAEPVPPETQPEPDPPPAAPVVTPAPVLAARPEPRADDAEQLPDPTNISPRILSRQFDYQAEQPLFGPVAKEPREDADYYVRSRPGLEEVLNAPSLQLPFYDKRIYLVDSYSPGFGGSVDRFFDNVTVPFGWTTKNNTRVQCAWVLVFAGCNWGHVSLFHREAKRRKPE